MKCTLWRVVWYSYPLSLKTERSHFTRQLHYAQTRLEDINDLILQARFSVCNQGDECIGKNPYRAVS